MKLEILTIFLVVIPNIRVVRGVERGGGGVGCKFKITSMPLRSTFFSLASWQVIKEQSMNRLTEVFWDIF